METLADYGTVQYFGVNVFSTGIFRTWFGLYDALAARQLASVLLMMVFALLLLEKLARSKASYSLPSGSMSSKRRSLKPVYACVVSLCCGLLFLDRKSTRLNSSHVRISYAVFCLKKKKKI